MANYDHSMISSSYFLLLAVISSLLIIPTTSDNDNILASICNGKLVPTNFLLIRDHLLVDIVNASEYGGHMEPSYSYEDSEINGLALCRGDISPDECKTCLTNVTSEMSKENCTMDTSLEFHDLCFVKYSSNNFFEIIDADNTYEACDDRVNAEGFPTGSGEFLDGLIGTANASKNMFASANYTYTSTIDTYRGLVQCTRDLDEETCTACLQLGIGNLLSDCSKNSLGGKYYLGSCIAMYYKIE